MKERINKIEGISFQEKEFQKDPHKYQGVVDLAVYDSNYEHKTVEDGRYMLMIPTMEEEQHVILKEGDFILRCNGKIIFSMNAADFKNMLSKIGSQKSFAH